MDTPAYEIERCQADELCIRLFGDLDEALVLACERDARARLRSTRAGSLRVLWDLQRVTGYTIAARGVLARLQGFLSDKAERTVYVAQRAEPRSLALWAVHIAGARQACIAAELEPARAWLQGRGEPAPSVRPLMSTRPQAVDECDKAAS